MNIEYIRAISICLALSIFTKIKTNNLLKILWNMGPRLRKGDESEEHLRRLGGDKGEVHGLHLLHHMGNTH